MLVQRSQVGSVIGRGGYKIKETREVLTESLCRDILTKTNSAVSIVVVTEMTKTH